MDKEQKAYDTIPSSIVDTKGRTWESHKEYLSGSIYWLCEEIKDNVYATPYFDGNENLPVDMVNEMGNPIDCWVEPIENDNYLEAIKTALGKIN